MKGRAERSAKKDGGGGAGGAAGEKTWEGGKERTRGGGGNNVGINAVIYWGTGQWVGDSEPYGEREK